MGGDVFSTCARHGDSSHSWWKHKDRLYTTINTKRSLCFRPECGILLLHVLPRTFDKAALFLRFLEAAVPGFHKGVTRNTVCRFHVWIPTPPRARGRMILISVFVVLLEAERGRESGALMSLPQAKTSMTTASKVYAINPLQPGTPSLLERLKRTNNHKRYAASHMIT